MASTSETRRTEWSELLGQMEGSLHQILAQVEAAPSLPNSVTTAQETVAPGAVAQRIMERLQQAEEQAAGASLALGAAGEALQQWLTDARAALPNAAAKDTA